MNAEQGKNIEQAIDSLCNNLVWCRGYFMSLKALHEVAKSSPSSLDCYPQFVSCLYHGLFDCLFIKIHNFFDRSKGACGFPHLFTILRRYCAEEGPLLIQIKTDETRFKNEDNIEKIKKWRDGISAHFTQDYRQSDFFLLNRLHLSELENLLNLIEETVGYYSLSILKRVNDTRHPSDGIIKEMETLFLPRIEQGVILRGNKGQN